MIWHTLVLAMQQAVPAVQTPPDPTVLAPYVYASSTVVFIQKWMKSNKGTVGRIYGAVVKATPGADRYAHWIVAAILSIVGTLGIHYSWNWSWDHGGHFVGDIPAGPEMIFGLLTSMGSWYKTFILQQTIYACTNQPAYAPPSQEEK